MKRITFFIGSLKLGGAERVISILTKYLAEEGYKVEIVLYYDREIFYDIHESVKITFIERETKTKKIFNNLVWFRRYIEKNSDVIISFLAPFNIFSLVSHIGLNNKIIVADRNDPHFIPNSAIARIIRNQLYKHADGVVCQTESNLKYFAKKVQNKGVVIFNPVDLGDKKGQALTASKEDKIVSVGRLTKQKNQKLAIDAFKLISDDFPSYKLWFYGDGDLECELKQYVDENGLAGRIVFPGSSKNIFDDESNAKMFLLTSDYEGMPNALIEAMCLGLPVISTKVSGATDFIEDGINGMLLSKRDAYELSEKMRVILSNTELQHSLGAEAMKMNKQLEVNTIMSQWVRFILSKMLEE